MSMSAGGLAAAVCIAVGFSIGLMKTLFPSVYDLIGSSCLVLVGMSLLVVCLIFCAAPYMHCFNSRELLLAETIKNLHISLINSLDVYLQLLKKSRLILLFKRSILNCLQMDVSLILLHYAVRSFYL